MLGTTLTLLEKTINEHGSAVVLREHLSLLRSEITVLERKLVDAEQKIAVLETEKSDFKSQSENQAVKIKDLEERLDPAHRTPHPDEDSILKHLSNCNYATVEEISKATGIGIQTTRMHVDNLEAAKLVERFDSYMSTHWRLTGAGRKLMFDLGLLN